MGRLGASAPPRGRQAGSCQNAGLSWSLHACIRSHPHDSQPGWCSRPRFREEKPRWGRPVAQWRPAQASGRVGPGARTRGKEARPEQSRAECREGAGPAPTPADARSAPSSFTPFPWPPSRHHPPLCRRLWVLLKNRNSLRSNHSSGPACSVYELRQVTQPLWASTSSFVKWGDAPAPLVGLP